MGTVIPEPRRGEEKRRKPGRAAEPGAEAAGPQPHPRPESKHSILWPL